MEVTATSLPFEEAEAYYRELGLALTREQFEAMKGRAFMVSGISKLDLLEDVKAEVLKAIEQGTTLRDFQAGLDALFTRRGWARGDRPTPWRVETIFRTNIQSAYQAGRQAQMRANVKRRPYWMYDALDDGRTRPSHAAMDGKVFAADDPIWDVWYPPNGFNCRCRVRALTESELRSRGLDVYTAGDVALMPDAGFEQNPAAGWEPDLSRYQGAALKIAEQIVGQV